MNWPKDGKLNSDQTGHPILWHATLKDLGYELTVPYFPPSAFVRFWGDDKKGSRIKSFGHKDPKDKGSAHFLITRGGLPWHTDPGYTRYALQVQLQNDGYLVCGIEDDPMQMPRFTRGLVTLLDGYSPHCVQPDPRLRLIGYNKLLAGMDFHEQPTPEAHIPEILAYLPKLTELMTP